MVAYSGRFGDGCLAQRQCQTRSTFCSRRKRWATRLIKTYSGLGAGDTRYSPGQIVNALPMPESGNAKPWLVSTSHIERQNLTIRMQLRRFTRLTNAFSKKLENLKAALCLHFAWYNFCRVHSTLRVTPAMAAGIAETVWPLSNLLTE